QPDGNRLLNTREPGLNRLAGPRWGQQHMDHVRKVAVITGGKRIGRVVARELAERGMNLVLSYRGSKEEAEQTVADVEAAGRRATIVSCDVSKPAECLGIFEHALATF